MLINRPAFEIVAECPSDHTNCVNHANDNQQTNPTFKLLLVDTYNRIQNMIGRHKLHPMKIGELHKGESVVLQWEPADKQQRHAGRGKPCCCSS